MGNSSINDYEVDGVHVWTMPITHNSCTIQIRKDSNKANGKGHRSDICPCCEKEFVAGETAVIIVNNSIIFPNVYVHDTCFSSYNISNLCGMLKSSYKRYLKHSRWW